MLAEKPCLGRSREPFSASTADVLKDLSVLLGALYPNRDIPALILAGTADSAFLSSFLEGLGPTSTFSDFSFFSSLFLLRKVLPSVDADVDAFLNKLAVQSVPDEQFMKTIDTFVPFMFLPGWDKEYENICRRVSLSHSSSVEMNRANGGNLEALKEVMTYEGFIELVLTGAPIPTCRKVAVIDKDGKQRIVTVASCFQSQLLPLHVLIYDHLTKKDWLLRGDAKVGVLSEFKVKKGEVFVSGDYIDATNNFNSCHSIRLLEMIFFHAKYIPSGIKEAAKSSLVGWLSYKAPGARVTSFSPQRSGQMMGNFLSFPLLCLTNFLTVVHALGWERANSIPLKINGDDIVFRTSREEFDLWSRKVLESGLSLSKGKTLVHDRFFSINSAFFCAQRNVRPRIVPTLRSAPIVKACTSKDSLASRIKSATWGWFGKRRRTISQFMLERHRKVACSGVVSLTRGYGVKVGVDELSRSNVLMAELVLLDRPSHLDVPRGDMANAGLGSLGFKERKRKQTCKECKKHQSARASEASARLKWDEVFEKEKVKEKEESIKINYKKKRVCSLAGMLAPRVFGPPNKWDNPNQNRGVSQSQYKKRLWSDLKSAMRTLWSKPQRLKKEENMMVMEEELCFRCLPPRREEYEEFIPRVVRFVSGA